ncbi:MAG: chromate transporter [Bacilli bacterium]|nr:chromate transporter [Bacilli bacterium]
MYNILIIFLTFLKIGAISFGGGFGMIPIITEEVVVRGWMSEEEVLNFIAISESTPGPIAVNMATFIGYNQGGILGAIFATLGVVLPAFIIILLIASILKKLLQYKGVNAFLDGVKPVVVGLILSTSLTLFVKIIFNVKAIEGASFKFDYRSLIIFAIITFVSVFVKKVFKKNLSPILLILLSGVLGIVFFYI